MQFFRGEQLKLRRSEIYHALRAIRNLVRDGREDARYSLETTGGTSIDWSKWSGVGSEKPVECEENVILAGHSFGGATVVCITVIRFIRWKRLTEWDSCQYSPTHPRGMSL